MVCIVSFTLIGLIVAAIGMRAISTPCDPVCARCGYDLRGHALRDICSECGQDLSGVGAIRRNVDGASRRVVVAGLALALAPWGYLGYDALHRYCGWGWERIRSNASLATEASRGTWMQFSLWDELAKRVASGRMSAAEASPVMNSLIQLAAANGSRSDRVLCGARFFEAADRAGVITPAQYLALARVFYGVQCQVSLFGPVQANYPVIYRVKSSQWNELPGLHRLVVPRKIAIVRAGLPPVNLLGARPDLLLPSKLPPGDYEITFDLQVVVAHGVGTINIAAPSAVAASVAQWNETVKVPIQVVDQDPITGHRQTTVRTDDAADPQKSGSLTVPSATELCFADRTLILVNFKLGNAPENFYFRPVLHIDGQTFKGSPTFFLRDRDDGWMHQAQIELHGQQFDDRPVTIEFEPDLENAQRVNFDRTWGKAIRFEDVPMKRHDFGTDFPGVKPATRSASRP